jgi:hypothetical protein
MMHSTQQASHDFATECRVIVQYKHVYLDVVVVDDSYKEVRVVYLMQQR